MGIAIVISLSLILIGGIKAYSKSWTVEQLIEENRKIRQEKDL